MEEGAVSCDLFPSHPTLVGGEIGRGTRAHLPTGAPYPHAGDTNGGNTPSYANQRIALTSLFAATQGYVTFFTFTDGLLALM
jgi:hypothetical protein